jgi:FAD:protein FMN transferase
LPQRLSALAGTTVGTTWSARLNLPSHVCTAQAQHAIQDAVDLVVAQMSTWETDSSISRYNQLAASLHPLPDESFHVLDYSLKLAAQTQGAYDPTIGLLVNAWGFGPYQRAFEPPPPKS